MSISKAQTFSPSGATNVYSRYQEPIGSVSVGESFIVETIDSYGGKFRGDGWRSPENHEWVADNLNVVTGPICVPAAREGDVVAVSIRELEVLSPATVVIGPFTDPSPDDWWLDGEAASELVVEDGRVHIGDGVDAPIRPVIGCIAVAPKIESVRTIHSGTFGGNLDCNLITTGATVLLPVEADGALLYFGDCKARMGDGEIVHAPECSMKITVEVAVLERPKAMTWPRVLTAEAIATIVSNPSLADACRQGFREMLLWVEQASGVSREKAALLLGMMAEVRVCQVSNLMHSSYCLLDREALGSVGISDGELL